MTAYKYYDTVSSTWKYLLQGPTGPAGPTGPSGAGDMVASVYDPTAKAADAFNRTNHTGTQLAATISDLTKTSVGLADVDNTSNATERAATATLTNKRITPRVTSIAGTTSPQAPTSDSVDTWVHSAMTVGMTFSAPTGTPTDGQKLMLRLKDDGTARTLTWNAIYRGVGVALPATTTISKTLYLGFVYNTADTKWDCIAVAQEA